MSPRTYGVALAILAIIVVAGTMTACEQGRRTMTTSSIPVTPTPAPAAPLAPTAETQAAMALKARGDELRDRGRADEALEAYQDALRQDPTDLGIRYGVAQLLAQLNRRAEAVTAYTWVFQNSLPGSDIARRAEQWLRESGAYTVVNETPSSGDASASAQGRLSGHLTWTTLDPNRPVPATSLILEGNDAATKGQVYSTRSVMNSDYEFTSVRPGGYRLIVKSQMVKIWETEVNVTPGGITVMDLEQSQSVAPPDVLLPKSGS